MHREMGLLLARVLEVRADAANPLPKVFSFF
jgi:hypothetical protein